MENNGYLEQKEKYICVLLFFFSERATTFEGKIMVMTEKK